ncbi:hypothetical protein GCM10022251_28220 [Phytohabitans flavus]
MSRIKSQNQGDWATATPAVVQTVAPAASPSAVGKLTPGSWSADRDLRGGLRLRVGALLPVPGRDERERRTLPGPRSKPNLDLARRLGGRSIQDRHARRALDLP